MTNKTKTKTRIAGFLAILFFAAIPLNAIAVELDVVMPPAGALAWCDVTETEAARTTTTTAAGTRYDTVCPLLSGELVNFTRSGNELTYTGQGQFLFLMISGVQKTDSPSVRVHIALHHKPNGGVDPWEEVVPSRTGAYFKTAGEAVPHAPAVDVLWVDTGDKLKSVTWSDKAGLEVITTHIALFADAWGR